LQQLNISPQKSRCFFIDEFFWASSNFLAPVLNDHDIMLDVY
jgi:hypothetical protein